MLLNGSGIDQQVVSLAADFVYDSIDSERDELGGTMSDDDKASIAISILSYMQNEKFYVGDTADCDVSDKEEEEITTLVYDALSLAIKSLY